MHFKLSIVLAFIAICVPQTSHAGKMRETKEAIVASPDKATIVFLRPGKFVGAAVAVPVFEVGTSSVLFAGIIDSGSKFGYVVAPGEHIFATAVAGGDAGTRIYKVNVVGGKMYYLRARIIDGIWGLEPVHASSLGTTEFKKWDRATDNTVNSEKTIAWGQENLVNVSSRIRRVEPNATFDAHNSLYAEDGL